EVAILPYYISNLNIEYTYKQRMSEYVEFENLCFVDTLDKSSLHFVQKGLFDVSAENATRIKRQNERKISVIIGNPPYNAKQENYNYQNANRAYKEIDKRIKDTYIKQGTAQNQIVVYDMYTRFYRWAMDRIDENGIIAFITNRSFIDGRAFDGFRKLAASEFNHIYIIDLGGDVRMNPKLSGTKNNVFGIQTGVSIMFLVRKNNKLIAETKKEFKELKREFPIAEEPVIEYKKKLFYSIENSRINYIRRPEMDTAKDKLEWLSQSQIELLDFDLISPDKHNNWINQNENEWEELIPSIDKDVKCEKSEQAIFKLYSRGVATQRDEWVYDLDKTELESKIKFMVDVYSKTLTNSKLEGKKLIKWDRELSKYLAKGIKKEFNPNQIITSLYRPFNKEHLYFDKHFNGMTYQWFDIFSSNQKNNFIVIPGIASPKDFFLLSSDLIIDLNCLPAGCQCLPLYRYTSTGERIDNITDWGLQQFKDHYQPSLRGGTTASPDFSGKQSPDATTNDEIASSQPNTKPSSPRNDVEGDDEITKEDIFNYTYAVLHNPAYRKKYELNLKREFPRIPFYENFFQWVDWGKQLMNLHINYETVEPFPLSVIARRNDEATSNRVTNNKIASSQQDTKPKAPRNDDVHSPKAKLKAIKESGIIQLDENTELHGIPNEAWEYKLGNRSALEWILDQYKEKKPTDPTIAEKFNTYKFADYKEKVIDLLKRVCTLSVETMRIVKEMEKV
ncbi:MAG: Eco57I restriction-modification methylase domain-containing protein, partial [Bacteroidota bacterium]|nr:Eco57I restriction-modification methylase domain-containing protein [Bacteroidota bacterium]